MYNERFLAAEALRRVLAVSIPEVAEIEVIGVDDGSTDGTREILATLAAEHPERVQALFHPTNRGKGAALRTGIDAATGDLVVFQDADLEYDPRDFARLVRPFLEDGADVVYGSRFMPSARRRVLYFRHTLGNRLITLLSNLATDLNLSDVETCYKMFRASLLKSIPLRSNGFGIEPEITAKVAKRQCRVFEVPISYIGRTYREGKKIGWRDGVTALATIARYWLVDDLYREDPFGADILHELEKAQRFNRWMADAVARFAGDRVLEIGAGIGNITTWLLPRTEYLATDYNPQYVDYLRNLASGKPYLDVERVDLEDPACFAPLAGRFDTVICLNVLEHVREPVAALRNIRQALAPGGRAVLYVPQGQRLYSSLDEVLEHRCRYDRRQLAAELAEAGLELERCEDFNRISMPAWWWNGKILRRRRFGKAQLKLFDVAVPVLRRVDRLLPWRGLGLLAVARRPVAVGPATRTGDPARGSVPALGNTDATGRG